MVELAWPDRLTAPHPFPDPGPAAETAVDEGVAHHPSLPPSISMERIGDDDDAIDDCVASLLVLH